MFSDLFIFHVQLHVQSILSPVRENNFHTVTVLIIYQLNDDLLIKINPKK